MAGLDDSDSSALTQSGDEVEESSPPPQDPSGPGTEVGTEVGDEEDADMAERSSPGGFHTLFQGLFVASQRRLPPTRVAQNPCQCQKSRKLRKLPRKAHLRVLVRVQLLHPLEPPRNESGRLV